VPLLVLPVFFLCLAGALCTAPLAFDIQAGTRFSLRTRYLWFSRRVSAALLRRLFLSADIFRTIDAYLPVFRKPLRLRRLRLRLVFSTGDAAETALLYGRLCVFFASLYPRLIRGRPEITLSPSFSPERELSPDCDISLDIPAAVFLFRMIFALIRGKGGRKKRSSHV
jgi:hypothetical protein